MISREGIIQMFNVKIIFRGRFQNKFFFKRFLSYQEALDFVYSKQKSYSNYVIGYIFDLSNRLEIKIQKNGLISCLSD